MLDNMYNIEGNIDSDYFLNYIIHLLMIILCTISC